MKVGDDAILAFVDGELARTLLHLHCPRHTRFHAQVKTQASVGRHGIAKIALQELLGSFILSKQRCIIDPDLLMVLTQLC